MNKTQESLNRENIFLRIMNKLHWSVLMVIISCIGILGYLGYIQMVTGKEIPPSLITTFASVIFALVGYGVGKSETA